MYQNQKQRSEADGNKLAIRQSKFLSLVLRHQPQVIGVELDEQGWIAIELLLKAMQQHGRRISHQQLLEICANCEKQRFKISEDGLKIRANQGHTVDIDLGLTALPPPAVLYHGTASRFTKDIFRQGLISGSRQHVHLTEDLNTARKVGARHGLPVILQVNAAALFEAGQLFYQSENQVWLTSAIAPAYLSRLAE